MSGGYEMRQVIAAQQEAQLLRSEVRALKERAETAERAFEIQKFDMDIYKLKAERFEFECRALRAEAALRDREDVDY